MKHSHITLSRWYDNNCTLIKTVLSFIQSLLVSLTFMDTKVLTKEYDTYLQTNGNFWLQPLTKQLSSSYHATSIATSLHRWSSVDVNWPGNLCLFTGASVAKWYVVERNSINKIEFSEEKQWRGRVSLMTFLYFATLIILKSYIEGVEKLQLFASDVKCIDQVPSQFDHTDECLPWPLALVWLQCLFYIQLWSQKPLHMSRVLPLSEPYTNCVFFFSL